MAHTRGPWRLATRSVFGRAFNGSWRSICEKVGGGNPGEADANTYLIAAAPELLAALKAHIVGMVTISPDVVHESGRFCQICGSSNGPDVHATRCPVLASESAIAKAEGRSL